ncbi:serine/threonine protein kinase [Microbacterium natoriense]|uniref:non-specific serine/threonine protein kinase n=1 Tax=Microbacterium natoriense TaxID=284570 RepID=A0AAW8EXI1_9MICO|nr:protein kinase [Microbacterium natoriense]MDQ0648236.1 serine/threonine protein kinase [Microbacterium natoriense]
MTGAADATAALIGGRYRLRELLGVGGSAAVYAADDTVIGGRFAVKLLHPHLCADAAHRQAFLAEAMKVQRIQHPNVVGVHGSGLHDAAGVLTPWIAFDLLTGATLQERIAAHGPLDAAEASAVLAGVLSGLSAAHRSDLIHRDLSPQNIILELAPPPPNAAITSDMVRIVDFGLADATGRSTVGGDVLLSGHDGEADDVGIIGSVQYMSPEQALGKPVRAASDLYQAGAILSFVLTGRVPFLRRSARETMMAHVVAPPPVPSALAASTAVLDRVVAKAMAKTPAHRYRSADDFRLALDAAVESSRVPRIAEIRGDSDPSPIGDRARAADDVDDVETLASTLRYPHGAAPSNPLPSLSDPSADADDAEARPAAQRFAVTVSAFVAVVLVVIAAWGVIAASGSTTSTPTIAPLSSATPSAPATAQEPPVLPAAPTPQQIETLTIEVPLLNGTLAGVDATLRAAGLQLGAVDRVDAPAAVETVIAQQIAPGVRVAPGSAIGVAVASGYNTVPAVGGMTVSSATLTLHGAGFVVAAVPSDAPGGAVVIDTTPAIGSSARVGTAIVLRVSGGPTPEPSATSVPGG